MQNMLLPDKAIHEASEIINAAAQVLPELKQWLAPPVSPRALIDLQVTSSETLRTKVKDVRQRQLLQTALQVLACAYRMQWGQATEREQVMALVAWRAINKEHARMLVESYFQARREKDDREAQRIFGD